MLVGYVTLEVHSLLVLSFYYLLGYSEKMQLVSAYVKGHKI